MQKGHLNAIFQFIFLLTFCIPAFSVNYIQEEEEEIVEYYSKDSINLTGLLSLLKSGEDEIIISDYFIASDKEDETLLIDKVFFSEYDISINNPYPVKVFFYNCTFHLKNNSPLILSGLQTAKLNIVNCEFTGPVRFTNIFHDGNHPVLIENCIFKDDLLINGAISNSTAIKFNNNEFSTSCFINIPSSNIKFNNCSFIANTLKFDERDNEINHYQLIIEHNEAGLIELESNTFSNAGNDNLFSINMEEVKVSELILLNNRLQTINLSYAEVEKSLLIDSLFVEDYIGIQNFDFPESNTNIPWYNIAGEKLAIFHAKGSGRIIPYQAKTNEQLANNLKYNDLLSAYTKFNSMYHNRGDINSANSSYVEIKDIETRRQAFIQEINPSLNNLINYKLNVFLRFFSDYATNPGKSLILSLWILLIFTILYMFTFSKWDGMNYRYYLNQYSLFSRYLTTEDTLEEVYTKENSDENHDIMEFLMKYKLMSRKTPRLLKLFGGPLHFLGKFRYKFIPGLIKLFNFHPGSWQSNSSIMQKLWSGLMILVISLLFFSYTIIVKFINSLVLSLNSFIVVGFGTLPEDDKLFAMYLSIIEGIIGWFLLTIFTITLFSQVLQNA